MRKLAITWAVLIAFHGAVIAQTQGPDLRSAAVKAALSPEYDAYVDSIYRDTPDSFEGLIKAILNWPLLGGHAAGKTELVSSSGRRIKRDNGPFGIQVNIENVKYSPGKVVLTVSKKLTGIFHQGGSSRYGSVEGYTLSRHLWMNTGSGWKLMATSQDEGWIRLNGKAFTSLPRNFDPNQAFKLIDVVNSAERQPAY
jgi:hypothetical protein